MVPSAASGTPPSARAFAPGGIGNLGPGLDILGCAVTGPGDRVRATRSERPGVIIEEPGHADLPRDPELHASGIAAADVLRRARSEVGVVLHVTKGLPLAGGQGGSAASAVASAVATNAVLGSPLEREELLFAALAAEEKLAGRHIDNLAPSLFGGILLVHSIVPLRIDALPVPEALRIVLVHPTMRLRTADARAVLPDTVPRSVALAQAAAVGAMIAAFCTGELHRLSDAVVDRIAEPVRAPLLPGFPEAKQAALDAGALGCSISGGGPSAFAFTDSDASAAAILGAMIQAYAARGMPAAGRVAEVDTQGARIEAFE